MITIQKLKLHGQYEIDVLYTAYLPESGMGLFRLASDEAPKQRLNDAIAEMQNICADIAGFPVRITSVTWSRSKTTSDVIVSVEGEAMAARIGTLKVKLPRWGRTVRSSMENGEFLQETAGFSCTTEEALCLIELEEALSDYIRHGSGQLNLSFTEERVDEWLSDSDRIAVVR